MDRATAVKKITTELDWARTHHPPMQNYHEGKSVIEEEYDELWEEIKRKHQDPDAIRSECIQVAAMALRFLEDLC